MMPPAERYDTSGFLEDQYEPGSKGTVLRNLLGITSREELDHVVRTTDGDGGSTLR